MLKIDVFSNEKVRAQSSACKRCFGGQAAFGMDFFVFFSYKCVLLMMKSIKIAYDIPAYRSHPRRFIKYRVVGNDVVSRKAYRFLTRRRADWRK